MPPLNTFKRRCLALAVTNTIAMPMQAATITVNTSSDTQSPALCTLRAAIMAANTNTPVDNCNAGSVDGADTISFTGLSNNSIITLTSELPVVTSTISVNGPGQDSLAISGDNSSRILSVASGGDLTLSSITLLNGSTTNDAAARGGAINVDSAILTINNSTLSDNSATSFGGGVFSRNSNITISNSILSDNYTAQSGGGISFIGSDIFITDSTVSDNSADFGGGVYSISSSTTIINSILSNNLANSVGGGISTTSNSVTTISESTISNNSTGGRGGGISSRYSSTITINDSSISDNSAYSRGGAFYSKDSSTNIINGTVSNNSAGFSGGGIDSDNSNIVINQSILSNNSAGFGGGGVSSENSSKTSIVNSTLSNNSANGGGGVLSRNSSTTISNSTVSNNSADSGGGVFASFSTLKLINAIVSGNTAPTRRGAEIYSPSDSNTLLIQHNVLGSSQTNDSAAFEVFSAGVMFDPTNIIASSDRLNLRLNQIIEPLADNGGPTLTHALPIGSPAFNLGDNANCPARDQRGEPRDNGPCDIGAFEGEFVDEESLFVIPLSNGKAVIFGI